MVFSGKEVFDVDVYRGDPGFGKFLVVINTVKKNEIKLCLNGTATFRCACLDTGLPDIINEKKLYMKLSTTVRNVDTGADCGYDIWLYKASIDSVTLVAGADGDPYYYDVSVSYGSFKTMVV